MKWFKGLVIGFLVTSVSSSLGNGFRNPPEGAAALGLGGGKIAVVDDSTALAHNPANIMEIKEPTVSLHLGLAFSGVEFDGPRGSDETDGEFKLLPNIFAVFPTKNEDLTWGIAITTPYGQFTEWPKDSPFAGSAPYFASLLTIDVAPTVAYRVSDAVTVAAGVDFMYSEFELKSLVPFGPGAAGRSHAETDGTGVGGNAAIQVQLSENHKVALTYTAPVEIDYEGDYSVGSIPPPAAGVVSPRSDFDTEIEFPTIIAVGYGGQITETIRLGVDVEWIEFSTFDSLPIDLGRNNAAGLAPPSIAQDWKDTWTAGFGVEWDADENWVWRAGYIFLESPVPASTVAPTLPDSDRHILSLGFGYHDEKQTFDVGYAYSIYEDLNVDSNQNPAYVGDYDLYAHLLSVSYGKSF